MLLSVSLLLFCHPTRRLPQHCARGPRDQQSRVVVPLCVLADHQGASQQSQPRVLLNVEGVSSNGLLEAIETDANALLSASKLNNTELSVTLCDEAFIQQLNAEWRGKDVPTDVLSFPMDDDVLLGDLIICMGVAERQAIERNHSTQDEVRILLVHGLLHLLGYDHEDALEEAMEMADAERRLLSRLQWRGEGLISVASARSGYDGR